MTPCVVAHQTPLSMDSPGENTGMGCHSLLQGIFLTQELNPGLLHYRQTLPTEPPGKPFLSCVSYLTSKSIISDGRYKMGKGLE